MFAHLCFSPIPDLDPRSRGRKALNPLFHFQLAHLLYCSDPNSCSPDQESVALTIGPAGQLIPVVWVSAYFSTVHISLQYFAFWYRTWVRMPSYKLYTARQTVFYIRQDRSRIGHQGRRPDPKGLPLSGSTSTFVLPKIQNHISL